MKAIRNIKVTAHYEVDTAPSKFDALLAQYEAAKAIADETASTKQPLIDAMGEKKLELIKQQLNVIVDRLNAISYRREAVIAVEVSVVYKQHKYKVKIETHWIWDEPTIYLDGYTDAYKPNWWFKEDGIVTLWNYLRLYEQLEQKCENMLEDMIATQNEKAERINTNYNNMINN